MRFDRKSSKQGCRQSSANGFWWAFNLGLFALAAACSPRPVPISVGRVIVDAPRSMDGMAAARDKLRDGIGERLNKSEGVTYARDNRDATHVMRVTLGDAFTPEGGKPNVPLEIALKATGDAGEFSATGAAPQGADVTATWFDAFDDAFAVLQRMRKLDVVKDDKLIGALRDDDDRVRDFAIQRLGERRCKAAVEPLCNLIKNEQEGESLFRVIGALVAIGDQRAVEPLIALSHQKDPAFVMQVAFAVGAIGGRTAKAYLVTLASGHPNEEIQRGAKDALEELTRRARATDPLAAHPNNAKP